MNIKRHGGEDTLLVLFLVSGTGNIDLFMEKLPHSLCCVSNRLTHKQSVTE